MGKNYPPNDVWSFHSNENTSGLWVRLNQQNFSQINKIIHPDCPKNIIKLHILNINLAFFQFKSSPLSAWGFSNTIFESYFSMYQTSKKWLQILYPQSASCLTHNPSLHPIRFSTIIHKDRASYTNYCQGSNVIGRYRPISSHIRLLTEASPSL